MEIISYYTEERLKILEKRFLELADDRFITLNQFQKLINARNTFIAKRIFEICNNHETERLSIDSFMRLVRRIIGSLVMEKLKLIFQIYDIDGDGKLGLDEVKLIIKNSMDDNELYFTDEEIHTLSVVVFESIDTDDDKQIDFDEFYNQLLERRGLIESLWINIENWFLPKPERKKRFELSDLLPHCCRWAHIRNNYVNAIFFLVFLVINVALWITRAVEYYVPDNPNYYYMIARACARCLYLDSTLLLVTMLRRSITYLRSIGCSSFLPLDDHIYFHKLIAFFVLFHGVIHSITHVIDFIVIFPSQGNYTATEYLFSPYATMEFGLIKGFACITGWILIVILLIIAIFAQPCVGRVGKFNIFFFTHSLFVLWFIALTIHAPHFWKWFAIPAIIYVSEAVRRMARMMTSSCGRTYVKEAKLLPSRVIHLAIERPRNFDYNAGDYVFINIPLVSRTEWHPFTISSSPEERDVIWLHIRAVGIWTNQLYKHFSRRVPTSKSLTRPNSQFHDKSPVFIFPKLTNGKLNKERTGDVEAGIERRLTQRFAKEVIYPMDKLINVYIDGPYGTPSTRIFNAQHAILIATGIGVTPFASILQSIMYRLSNKQLIANDSVTLSKVDFIWVNREQKSFEWFVRLLLELENQLEPELERLAEQFREQSKEKLDHETDPMEREKLAAQLEIECRQQIESQRILSLHMYITSASDESDIRSLILQLALDMMRQKTARSFITGLRDRTQPGRPDWHELFKKIEATKRGEVTVFFCGAPQLASLLTGKCNEFGFKFRKEVF